MAFLPTSSGEISFTPSLLLQIWCPTNTLTKLPLYVWQNGVNSTDDFEKHLVPGVVLTIRNTGGNTLECDPSHVVLYVGKKNGATHHIIHQYSNQSYLEPLFKMEGGRFEINQVYQIVIPKTGYSLY